MIDLSNRIENYWDNRSENFSKNRRMELIGADGIGWQKIFSEHLPKTKLKILDVGTGAGFFAIILSKLGHEVVGVDMSAKMIAEAEKNSREFDCDIKFYKMDAQKLDFADESFDVVVSRNLTWTLPDVMAAYREWRRVLKVGGLLMNFDSDYGDKDFTNEKTCAKGEVENNMLVECQQIKDSMKISTHTRPSFDIGFLCGINFSVRYVEDISETIHQDKNLQYDSVPVFAIYAKKNIA